MKIVFAGTPEFAVPALRARTEDLDATVREAARDALEALGVPGY